MQKHRTVQTYHMVQNIVQIQTLCDRNMSYDTEILYGYGNEKGW